jgi:hypothetical protein
MTRRTRGKPLARKNASDNPLWPEGPWQKSMPGTNTPTPHRLETGVHSHRKAPHLQLVLTFCTRHAVPMHCHHPKIPINHLQAHAPTGRLNQPGSVPACPIYPLMDSEQTRYPCLHLIQITPNLALGN